MHYFTWKLELVSNILWVIVGSKIQLQQTILIFLGKIFPKKRILPVKNKKNEHHHWILCTRTSLSTEFQPKLTILTFWIKFVWKWCFRSKTKSEHHHWIKHFRINLGTKLQLKLTILVFWIKFAKKGIFGQKQIKSVSPMNCAYLN